MTWDIITAIALIVSLISTFASLIIGIVLINKQKAPKLRVVLLCYALIMDIVYMIISKSPTFIFAIISILYCLVQEYLNREQKEVVKGCKELAERLELKKTIQEFKKGNIQATEVPYWFV